MAYKKKNVFDVFGAALVLSALLSTASAVNCHGKSFHCVNSTHFMICVDVGGGVSQSLDDFLIHCPPPTVCQRSNHFECEFPTTTTLPTSQSTMAWDELEQVDVTTVSPQSNTTMEFSEKYMNTVSITGPSADTFTTDATFDYTTEAASVINDTSKTETVPAVTKVFQNNTSTSKDVITTTEHNAGSAGLQTEMENKYTLVQQETNDASLVSTSTEESIHVIFNVSYSTESPAKLTTEGNVNLRKTIDLTEKTILNQEETSPEAITSEISVVTELPTTTSDVVPTDVNVTKTEQQISTADNTLSNTNMSDIRTTTEPGLHTTLDATTVVTDPFPMNPAAELDVLPTTLNTILLNDATTTGSTVENVALKQQNTTVFTQDVVSDTNANLGIGISREPNVTDNKPISTKNISSEFPTSEHVIADISNNSISTGVPAIETTQTVYNAPSDIWSTTNEEMLDQTTQTHNSKVTEGSVVTELPLTDGTIDSSISVLQNAENATASNYLTTTMTTSVKENIRTGRPNITLVKENTVTEVTTNGVTDSLAFPLQSTNENAPENQLLIDNTGIESPSTEQTINLISDHSDYHDNFARGTENITTNKIFNETKLNEIDQMKLGPDSIVANTNVGTESPTTINDSFMTEILVIKNNKTASAENKILNTDISDITITTDIIILENSIGADQQKSYDTISEATERPNIELKQNVSNHSNSTSEIVISESVGTSANIKDEIVPTTTGPATEYSATIDQAITEVFGNNASTVETEAPQIVVSNVNENIVYPNKAVEQVESQKNIYIEENLATAVDDNYTPKKENTKTIMLHETLSTNAVNMPTEKITNSLMNIENELYNSPLDNIGRTTENVLVQDNSRTEQPIIKEIKGSITTDKAFEVTSEEKIYKNQILVKDKDFELSSAQPNFIKEVNKTETADNYYLHMITKGFTEEPNDFIHGDTTNTPFIVTTNLATSVENNNVSYINAISNIMLNTDLNKSEAKKVETTTGGNIAFNSGLSDENILIPNVNQVKQNTHNILENLIINEKTTEHNVKVTESSLRATITTEKQNSGTLPINTVSDDSGVTSALDSYGIREEFKNDEDVLKTQKNIQSDTNFVPIMSVNDKTETTSNHDQFNYLTDSSLDDNSQVAVTGEEDKSTLDATNSSLFENTNISPRIINNTIETTNTTSDKNEVSYKINILQSETRTKHDTSASVPKVQDIQYYNLGTETYGDVDVDTYPKLTIMEESFPHVPEPTRKTSQNDHINQEVNGIITTTTSSIDNEGNIFIETSTSVDSVRLTEVSISKTMAENFRENGSKNLLQTDKTLQPPAISSIMIDKPNSSLPVPVTQDEDGITSNNSTTFAPNNVQIPTKRVDNQGIEFPEHTSGPTKRIETVSPYVTQFEATTKYIGDGEANRKNEVHFAVPTTDSTIHFTQLDVQNTHKLIDEKSSSSGSSLQLTITDADNALLQSVNSVQESKTDSLFGNPSINVAKASEVWDSISKPDNNIKWEASESLDSASTKQDININLPTKISTDSSKSYPEITTDKTINIPPVNKSKGINNGSRTDAPTILVIRNKSIDNPQSQQRVVNVIVTDDNQITTSTSVSGNAEPSPASITPTNIITVTTKVTQPREIVVNASSITLETKNNKQGNSNIQEKIAAKQTEVVRQIQLLSKTSNTEVNQIPYNSSTAANNIIASNVYWGNTSTDKESNNLKNTTTNISLLSPKNMNVTKVTKTPQKTISSHKTINSVNNTVQASTKTIPPRPLSSVTENPKKQVPLNPSLKYRCINGTRGRYSDKDDCRNFYICVGHNQPIVGTCPANTVFSDLKKLCTRNLSHCIRENQFKCPTAGRFSDLVNDVYYICVNYKNILYRFKFQCQNGFTLNKTTSRCMENKEMVPNDVVMISSSDSSDSGSGTSSASKTSTSNSISDNDSSNSSQSKKSEENKGTEKAEEPEKPENKDEDESDDVFVCRKEGKFPIPNECRRYYLCKKHRKEYRRKIKKCGSGDVFHKSKKKCVHADSYEC